MAIPTYVGAGALASGTAAITPALPASLSTNDILMLAVETRGGQSISLSDSAGGDWTLASSPAISSQETGAGVGHTRLTVFLSRYNGTQTAPTTVDSGDHQIGVIVAFRGVVASGAPHEAPAGSTKTSASTTVTIGGTTTTGSDRLAVVVCTRENDASGAHFSNWVNADLVNVTERFDDGNIAGTGGGIAIVTGEKAASGAYGNTTADLSVSTINAFTTFALIPAAGGSAPVNTVAPAVTGNKYRTQTLTTTDGTWTGDATITFTYQWQRDNAGGGSYSNIVGATANTRVLDANDVGNQIRCVVTGTNGVGNSSANSNAITAGDYFTAPVAGTGRVEVCGNATIDYSTPAATGGTQIQRTLLGVG